MHVIENLTMLNEPITLAAVLDGLHAPFDAGHTIAFVVNPVSEQIFNEASEFVGHWICISLHPNENKVEIRDSLQDGEDHTDIARQLGDLFFQQARAEGCFLDNAFQITVS